MRYAIPNLIHVLCVIGFFAGGLIRAEDGTVQQTGNFSTPATWVDGVIPGGAGATLYVKGNHTLKNFFTNAVLGHIVTPADTPVSGLTSVFTFALPYESRISGSPDPVYSTYRFGVFTNYLTLDSGVEGEPATIRCLPPLTGKFRYAINIPLLLKSDLEVQHNGLASGNWSNPLSAVWLGQNIREEGGRRTIRVRFDKEDMQLMLKGSNTFSGDLIVEKGIVRAGDLSRYNVPGNQFGVDNTLIATSGVGTVDVNGLHFGPEKTILIGGRGANGMGALTSGCQSPNVTSVWSGPVTLVSDAAVAGTVSRYPRNEGGNLRIDGTIADEGRACQLENVSLRNLVLAGDNTYRGGTLLTSGFLTALTPSSLGSGPLIFNGGAFRIDSSSGVDPSSFTLVSTNGKPVQVVTDGTDFTLGHALTGFTSGLTKSGPGALILKHDNAYTGTTAVILGDLILDYSEAGGQKTPADGTLSLGNNARLILRNGQAATPDQAVRTLSTYKGANARVIHDSAMPLAFNFLSPHSDSVLNLEGEGPYKVIQTSNGSESSANPNILPANILYKGRDWAVRITSDNRLSNFTDYASDWSGSNKHVDVTAALAQNVPANLEVATLRFNTPNNGNPIVLNLSGTNQIKSGAILVTEAMGDTPVHITGGAIARMGSGNLIIYNFNTQAVVRIDSQLLGFPIFNTNGSGQVTSITLSNIGVMKAGPGKVILGNADNRHDHYTWVLDGEMEIAGPECLGVGSWHHSWKSVQNFVMINNGATLTTTGSFDFAREVYPGCTNITTFDINSAGGVLNVSGAGDRIANLEANPSPVLRNGGRLIKRGAGTWFNGVGFGSAADQAGDDVTAREYTMTFDVEEGAIEHRLGATSANSFLGEGTMIMTVRNNAVLKGAGFLNGNNGGANGGGNVEDVAVRKVFHVDAGGAIVDLNGTAIKMGAVAFDTLTRASDWLEGPGMLTITNSSDTSADFCFYNLLNHAFTGRFDGSGLMAADATSGGGLPNGELFVPEHRVYRFTVCHPSHYPLRFGRLTGTGAFGGRGVYNSDSDNVALIGCDDNSLFEFGGYLWGTWGSANRGAFRFVKVGNNTWRISGTTNAMTTSVTLRKGTILVGANSPGNGTVGALGTERVILSDAETAPGDALSLLTDGPYTVGNGIILMDYAPGAIMTLGGNQTTGASTFTGDLVLTHDVCLHAANTDNNGVTFTGAITGPGGIIKTGSGKVILTGSVQNTAPHTVLDGTLMIMGDTTLTNALVVAAGASGSGTLAVTGNLTIGEGVTLTLQPDSLVRGQTYTLATWTGTLSGSFASVTGLPDGWHVGRFPDHLELYYAPPGTQIRIR
ncbi:MAG TPA: hypothetical protein PLJ32_01605 [Kiritimatiellia bacterium]|nr:hypothetical protein [Kiritimatiellia bacterium]